MSDPLPSMETFIHIYIISIINGLILLIGIFGICYYTYLKNIKNNTSFFLLTILTFLLISSFIISYILYSIQILTVNATLNVGKKSLSFCGKNIYLLDTGEYKVANGYSNFASLSNLSSKKLFKISNIISNTILLIIYTGLTTIILHSYILSSKLAKSDGIILSLGKNTIKTLIIYIYAFIIISGIFTTYVLTNVYMNNSNITNKLSIAYNTGPLSSIVILSLLLIIPFNKDNFLSNLKTYYLNFIDILKYKNYHITLFILIIFLIIVIILNYTISNSNTKLDTLFKTEYINKYIYSYDKNNKDTLDTISNLVISVIKDKSNPSEIDTYWIDYFKKNIKNVYSKTNNIINGDDDSLIKDYKDELWKYIQFNDGKEFDEILFKIKDYILEKQIDLSIIKNYRTLIKIDKNYKGTNNTDTEIPKINNSLDQIIKFRKICNKLRNDDTINSNVNQLTKNLITYTLILLIIILYIVIHFIVKTGNRNILNYMVFISISFAVLMALYGWATGFTYI